ncbi:hypothetical protein JOF56_002650 [Kibdelosporangium banguiense]|uniref:Sigma-70 family RNA polymerase sigma factor n=1 Tax=Kibdelosporangium banguiense TaxID=1365924 RepID=A0ABS4TDX1_9PSEU|nr:hypothetical protein [Kibdelosporangium banguiense]
MRRPLPVRWLPAAFAPQPEQVVLTDERDRQLWAAFQALPDRCQRLLRVFAYAPDYTYAQLADAAGIGESSVGSMKGRCLKALKLKLDRRVFDQVDPMPEVIAVPQQPRARFAAFPEPVTRSAAHSLKFGHGDCTVQVEIGAALHGLVTPVTDVQVWWPDGMVSVDVDEYGLFTARKVPPGPVRLVVDGVVTDWFVR